MKSNNWKLIEAHRQSYRAGNLKNRFLALFFCRVLQNALSPKNTYYKCKNDYEDNLAIQNEIFKIYDFDFGGEQVEVVFA